ncbi:hypothetical protein QIA36_05065 (plasmid) [Borreliella yangtzensis]
MDGISENQKDLINKLLRNTKNQKDTKVIILAIYAYKPYKIR